MADRAQCKAKTTKRAWRNRFAPMAQCESKANGLRSLAKMGRWSGWMPVEMAQDILAELKRLRRIERAAKALVGAARFVDRNHGRPFGTELKDMEDALKKGGRK